MPARRVQSNPALHSFLMCAGLARARVCAAYGFAVHYSGLSARPLVCDIFYLLYAGAHKAVTVMCFNSPEEQGVFVCFIDCQLMLRKRLLYSPKIRIYAPENIKSRMHLIIVRQWGISCYCECLPEYTHSPNNRMCVCLFVLFSNAPNFVDINNASTSGDYRSTFALTKHLSVCVFMC